MKAILSWEMKRFIACTKTYHFTFLIYSYMCFLHFLLFFVSVSFFLTVFTLIYLFLFPSFFILSSHDFFVCLFVCAILSSNIYFFPSHVCFCPETTVLFLDSTAVKRFMYRFYQALPLPHSASECTFCSLGSVSLLILKEIPRRLI
jgi:hypothetical protein